MLQLWPWQAYSFKWAWLSPVSIPNTMHVTVIKCYGQTLYSNGVGEYFLNIAFVCTQQDFIVHAAAAQLTTRIFSESITESKLERMYVYFVLAWSRVAQWNDVLRCECPLQLFILKKLLDWVIHGFIESIKLKQIVSIPLEWGSITPRMSTRNAFPGNDLVPLRGRWLSLWPEPKEQHQQNNSG